MKLFLVRLACFACLFVVLNTIAQSFVSPHYGNEAYRAKLAEYRRDPGRYNTIFFGSSKTYRHVVPQVFDSELARYGTASFNLGSPASFNPEIYFLLEHFLEDAPASVRHVVLELQPLVIIDGQNLNTARSYYWHNARYLGFALSYAAASDHDPWRKWILSWRYGASLALKHLNFPRYKELRQDPSAQDWLGAGGRGHVSLDEELSRAGGAGRVQLRRDELASDPGTLRHKLAAADAFETVDHAGELNEAHLEKLEELIALAERRGIQLVIVIPPLMGDYGELIALKERLPRGRVIEIASRAKYPELYSVEHVFDIGHLNRAGALLFTRHLAREFERFVAE